MKKSFDNLPESYKETIKVSLPFIIIVLLFVLVGKFGISQVVALRNQIIKAEKSEKTLTEKLNILKTLSQTPTQYINAVSAALPSSSPTISAISQLKLIAANNSINLSEIKAGTPTEDAKLSFVNISFLAVGTRENIMNFMKNLENSAPISRIDKIRISESGGIESVNISMKTYWADLPKTIPTVTQPVTDLNASEKQLMLTVSAYLQPTFSAILPSSGEVNTAPFGQ